METQAHCPHCHRVHRNGAWCCEKAELEALRLAADAAIQVLDYEVRGPLVLGIGGTVREAAQHASATLKAARRVG